MTEVLSAMLDELMGQYRNEAPENRKEVSFTQDFVCKYFLAGYCPNELFTNTKFDLGICNMSHDEKFKTMYEEDKRYGKLGYEERWEKFIRRMCDDMDVKIRKARERLELTQPQEAMELIDSKRYSLVNDMILLNQQLKQVQAQKQALLDSFATSRLISNKMDLEANIEAERQTLEKFEEEIEKIRVMRKGAHKLLRDHDMSHGNSQNTMAGKAMDVCNTCGCFTCHGDSIYLDSDDTELCGEAPQRVVDHLQGKLHSGFTELRKTLGELDKKRELERAWRDKQREEEKVKRDEERKKRDAEREKERAEKDKRREEERKARKELEKAEKEKNPDERKRSRSREKERDKDRDRKRSRRDEDDKRRGNRSDRNRDRDRRRDRDDDRRRKRSRSRSKSKSRNTRRSRSRDRKTIKNNKRSRSKDRRRDRSISKDRDLKDSKLVISERESPERPTPMPDIKTE